MTASNLNGNSNGNGNGHHENNNKPTLNGSSTPHEDRCAWATLLTSEHLLPGLMVFAQTLLVDHSSNYPLVIMCTSKLSQRARSILSTLYHDRVILRDIEPIYPKSTATSLAYARFNEVWTKLRAFELTEYQKVVLVDSDMLVRKNMDELFQDTDIFPPTPTTTHTDLHNDKEEREIIGASWACTCNPNKIATYPSDWIPENCGFTNQEHPQSLTNPPQPKPQDPRPTKLINSGLVVLRPNQTTMNQMIDVINTDPRIPEYRFPDQDFLADFFTTNTTNPTNSTSSTSNEENGTPATQRSCQRSIKYLPWCYNGLKKLRLVHQNIWRDAEVKNIHYILDKPWTMGKPGSSANPIQKDPDHEIHSWWWTVFEHLQQQVKNPKSSNVEKDCLDITQQDWLDCVEKYVTLE